MPDYSQNFNRYSYALNNPLVYSDPSGEFFIGYTFGFYRGLFSGKNPFKEGWKTGVNEMKIYGGLFASDPNKSTGGQIWEVASRFTWQLPQTIGGFTSAYWTNNLTEVNWVKYKYGATVLQTNGNWGGITQGSYIIGDKRIEADANNPLFQHEYGHYIQSQSSGWAYYPRYALPSLWSKNAETHVFNPIEQDANTRAFKYFNKHITGFSDNIYYGEDKHGWDFWSNPIDPNKTGKRTNHWDYNNSEDMKLVNSLLISPAWYDYASWLIFPIGPIWAGKRNANYYNNQY
jgi:hypothetical protein